MYGNLRIIQPHFYRASPAVLILGNEIPQTRPATQEEKLCIQY